MVLYLLHSIGPNMSQGFPRFKSRTKRLEGKELPAYKRRRGIAGCHLSRMLMWLRG